MAASSFHWRSLLGALALTALLSLAACASGGVVGSARAGATSSAPASGPLATSSLRAASVGTSAPLSTEGLTSNVANAASTAGDVASPTGTIAPTVRSTSASKSAAPNTTHAAPRAAKPDLESQLLTVADLPVGWAVSHDTSSSGGASLQGCTAPNTISDAADHADASFADQGSLPQLGESIGWWTTSAAATKAATVGIAAFNKCVGIDAGGAHATIGAMSFPPVGDQTGAWALNFDVKGIQAGMDIVLFRKGPEVALVYVADIGAPDTDTVEHMVKLAARKIA